MKNKTITLSLFSAFLFISVTWIAPIQVKAYDSAVQQIVDKMNEIGERLSSDEDFRLLVQLHNNQEVRNIFLEVIEAESEDVINSLVQQYLNIMDEDLLKSLFLRLDDKFGEDVESLVNSIYEFDSEKEYNLASNYYKITEDTKGIKVTKQKNEAQEDNTWLIRGEDLAFKRSETGNWFTKEELVKLKSFVDPLMWCFLSMIVFFVGSLILVLAEALINLGSIDIGSKVYILGYAIMCFAAFLCFGDLWLEPILEWLESLVESSSKKTNKSLYLEDLRNRLSNFIKFLLLRLTNISYKT